MITIGFIEDIDGEPTPSPRNDAILDARRAHASSELGPQGPAYFMPAAALLTVPTAAQTAPEPPKALLAARQLRLLAA